MNFDLILNCDFFVIVFRRVVHGLAGAKNASSDELDCTLDRGA